MTDQAAPDDTEIEERGIASVGSSPNGNRIVPGLFLLLLVGMGVWVMVRGVGQIPEKPAMIPASVRTTEYSTGVDEPPVISAFDELRRRLLNPDAPPQPVTPAPAPIGESRLDRQLRLARARQEMELERQRQEAELKAAAAAIELERRRLERQIQEQQAAAEELKQRERAKTVVFDASTDKGTRE